MDGRRFDRWTQRLARTLSPEGSAELADDHTRPAVGQVPPAVATPAVADGTCAYPDLITTPVGSQGICGWEHSQVVPTSNGDPAPARTGRSARRQRAQRLSSREQQVAALIGQGMKNREIAVALVLSEHTVHAHVRNVLAKLGLSSRAQIAAWVATHAPDGQGDV